VSGPLLDRFDLRVLVERPEISELLAEDGHPPPVPRDTTEMVARRVARARSIARKRGVICNSALPGSALDQLAPLTPDARGVLETRLRQGHLSARGLHRVRRVARTIADLAGRSGPIQREDVYSALALRADVFKTEAPEESFL
jgi:magnesium chelatase family protein